MKLSYIVPVYNVEDYLDDCIQSLYSQSLPVSDFEVIVINDGSTDGSAEVIKKYMERYPNMHFFDQSNQGLSVTRNRGIGHASGNYILFVDSDDFLVPDTVSILLQKAIDNDLDLLRGEYKNSNEQGVLLSKAKQNCKKSQLTDKIIDGNTLYQYIFCEEFYSPLLMIKREFLLNNDLFFEQGIYFEDVEFALKISLVAKKVLYLPIVFYIYRIRSSSITHTINEKKIKDLVSIVLKLRFYSMQTFVCNQTRCIIEENVTRLCVYLLLRLSELSANQYNRIVQPLLINRIRPLFVSGGVKEKVISLLFNICSTRIIPLLYPLVWLKNKWEK